MKELDAGPTFGVMTERIRPDDTAGDLLARLAEGGAGLLVATLDGLEDGSIEARPQQAEGVSLAPKISVEDARVDWREPAAAVDRRVRACTPAPGAWTTFEEQRIKLGPVSPVADAEPLAPGVLAVGRNEVLVGTGTAAGAAGPGQGRSARSRCRPPTGRVARGSRRERSSGERDQARRYGRTHEPTGDR